MPIAIGVPTLLAHPRVDLCLQSWVRGRTGCELIVQVNATPPATWLEPATAHVLRSSTNLGVARSWNHLAEKAWAFGHDIVCLVNDDVEFLGDPNMLFFADAVLSDIPRQLLAVRGLGFSCFFLTERVWDEVGPFDADFFPAYYEDKDYEYRLKLAGIPIAEIAGDVTHHGGGSQTIAGSFEMRALIDYTGNLNKARYQQKWGGFPGDEVHRTPWGR